MFSQLFSIVRNVKNFKWHDNVCDENANADDADDDDADGTDGDADADDILVAVHTELPRAEHFPYCTGS